MLHPELSLEMLGVSLPCACCQVSAMLLMTQACTMSQHSGCYGQQGELHGCRHSRNGHHLADARSSYVHDKLHVSFVSVA